VFEHWQSRTGQGRETCRKTRNAARILVSSHGDESKWNVAEMEQRGRRRTERREAGQNGLQLVSRSNRKPLACLRRRWTEAQRISTKATKQIQVAKHDPASSGLRVPVPKDPSVCNLNPMTPNSIVQSCRHNNHRHPKRNVETRCRSTRGR
jgi:hypothetical protein